MSAWQIDAACRRHDPELWFSQFERDRMEARAVCATCPVHDACYQAGLGEDWGVWGGSDREREGSRGQRMALATHCRNGHDYTHNGVLNRRGHRLCRTCERLRQRKRRDTRDGWLDREVVAS